jgi:hypothetical protein
LLEAPELPPNVPSNSLLADSLARLVRAATVEVRFAVTLAVELAAGLAGAAEAWLLLTLPIDIMAPIATAGIRVIGRDSISLRRKDSRGSLHHGAGL